MLVCPLDNVTCDCLSPRTWLVLLFVWNLEYLPLLLTQISLRAKAFLSDPEWAR